MTVFSKKNSTSAFGTERTRHQHSADFLCLSGKPNQCDSLTSTAARLCRTVGSQFTQEFTMKIIIHNTVIYCAP